MKDTKVPPFRRDRDRVKVKQLVIVGMLISMIMPFILITDLYPFFRFGMFAEPVKRSIQLEQFALQYQDEKYRTYIAHPEALGLVSLPYLMRNYYYRGETELFLRHIAQIYKPGLSVEEWQFIRITSKPSYPAQMDTTVVASFRPKPL